MADRAASSMRDDLHPCPHSNQIENLWKLVYGNGDEGLQARLARIEERMDQLREDIRELREEEMQRMEMRLRWSISLFMVLASFIGNLLLKYFWR